MSRATPQMRNLAERLIAHEAREIQSSGRQSMGTFAVWERLRPPLAALGSTTMQLVREVWPKLFLNDVYVASGDADEIEKKRTRTGSSLTLRRVITASF